MIPVPYFPPYIRAKYKHIQTKHDTVDAEMTDIDKMHNMLRIHETPDTL